MDIPTPVSIHQRFQKLQLEFHAQREQIAPLEERIKELELRITQLQADIEARKLHLKRIVEACRE